jgi:hypothetical protein
MARWITPAGWNRSPTSGTDLQYLAQPWDQVVRQPDTRLEGLVLLCRNAQLLGDVCFIHSESKTRRPQPLVECAFDSSYLLWSRALSLSATWSRLATWIGREGPSSGAKPLPNVGCFTCHSDKDRAVSGRWNHLPWGKWLCARRYGNSVICARRVSPPQQFLKAYRACSSAVELQSGNRHRPVGVCATTSMPFQEKCLVQASRRGLNNSTSLPSTGSGAR